MKQPLSGRGIQSANLIDVQFMLLTILSTRTPATGGLLEVAMNGGSTIFVCLFFST